MEYSRKVNLKPIDPEKVRIEMVQGSKDTYAIIFELDSLPDNTWTRFFYDSLGKDMRIAEAIINGANITVLTSADDIKKKVYWTTKLVDYTNQQVEIHNKNVEEKHEEARRRKAKGEEDIKKMRKLLKQ
jgi:hypothetical protein